VLRGVVSGEQAPFCLAVIGVIGCPVLGIEVALIAACMPIKQADDHLMGYGSGDSGRGDDLAEGMAHGVQGGEGDAWGQGHGPIRWTEV